MTHQNPDRNRQNNRNLFPIFAVLAAAGTTVGICALVLNLADTVGGAPTPITAVTENRKPVQQEQTLSTEGSTLSASGIAPATLPISTVLGTHSAPVVAIAATQANASSSPLVITASQDTSVRTWSIKSNRKGLVATLPHNSHVNALALISNSTGEASTPPRLATGSGSGEIKLWDLEFGTLLTTIADGSGRVLSMAASADAQLIASGSSQGTLKIWPVAAIAAQKSQTNLRGITLQANGPAVSAIAFHPTDPNLLITGSQEGTLHLWNTERRQITLTLAATPAPNGESASQSDRQITSLSISPDGRYVASVSSNLIRIWDIEAGQLTQTLSGHRADITSATFSPDGTVLASSSADQTVKTWNWAEGLVYCTLSDRAGSIRAIAFANDADTLISGSSDGTVRAWDLGRDSNSTCVGR